MKICSFVNFNHYSFLRFLGDFMVTLTPFLNDADTRPLYQQLYAYIRNAIVAQDIFPGEKLPSLRSLSRSLKISVTTVELAYDQLLVEGYIHSKPQSGYYVNQILKEGTKAGFESSPFYDPKEPYPRAWNTMANPPLHDSDSFDFAKWKKCLNTVVNDFSSQLFQEGDPYGELPLRYEISKYSYQARGVRCSLDQVIIGAGTQQLINLLGLLLHRMGIDYASFEDPGYLPVRGIFQDRGFQIAEVPVDRDGITIEKLPTSSPSTVYVSPSNQFPTGSVMPIGKRYALLDWASKTGSIIIEDDYNSELRYSGRPVPSLQGLDEAGCVVYLGSFSSTLYPSIKISYMILPPSMRNLFPEVVGGYTQTCSKAEQLTLALYMERGYYQVHLKKLRKLYTQKILKASVEIERHLSHRVKILSNASGLHMLLALKGQATEQVVGDLCKRAREEGLTVSPIRDYGGSGRYPLLLFYFARIPAKQMEKAIQALALAFDQSGA